MSDTYQPRRTNAAERPAESPKKPVAGIVVLALLLLVEAGFVIYLAATKLLPVKFLLLIAVVLLVLLGLVAVLVLKTGKKGRFISGTILAVLIAAVLLVAGAYIAKGVNTLSSITETKKEIAHIGVYVCTGSEAETLNDIADGKLGILAELDRDNVDRTLDKLEADLACALSTVEYKGLSELLNALYNGQVAAVVFNDAYIGMLEEMDEFYDVSSRIRELTKVEIESETVEEVVTTETEGDDWLEKPQHVFTLYISGIDSRNGLTAKSRSDVNILALVNTKTHQVLLVSTPRDYYVPLPISNGNRDKLTHAGIYGVSVSMGTLEMIYNIDVDYYFRVNFEGFEEIIDSLGGVNVNSEVAFSAGGYSFHVGANYLNGEAALAFARERKSLAGGDRQRGKNQMAVIKGVINKALSPEILTSYASLMEAVEGSFETSVPYDMIASMVRQQLDQGGGWNIVSYSVDGSSASKQPWSMNTNAYVMIPDESTIAAARELMRQLIDGDIISAP